MVETLYRIFQDAKLSRGDQSMSMLEFDKYDISRMPGLLSYKDLDSKYLGITEELAHFLGWKDASQSIGKTDYDLPCKASESADEFIKQDRRTIESGLKTICVAIEEYNTGWHIILGEKNPIKDENGQITSLFINGFDVSNVSQFRASLVLRAVDNKFHNRNLKATTYFLTPPPTPKKLTEKQESCLFLMIRGKTAKEIAKILQVSPRTIECHIEAIKSRLDCQTRSEIIGKAIDNDFLYYIPKNLCQNGFEKLVSEL
jgi:DNA-binding CsgD family transcriptional regulator